MSTIKQNCKKALAAGIKFYHLLERDKISAALVKEHAVPALSAKEAREARLYWKQYGYKLRSTAPFRLYYGLTGIHDPRFVPSGIFFHEIVPRLNPLQLSRAWEDKAYLQQHLSMFSTPQTIVANINGILVDAAYEPLSAMSANALLQEYAAVIVKPTMDSGQGKNVCRFSPVPTIEALTEQYKKDFVIQVPIRQSAATARFNSSSVNCIRVNSLWRNGQAEILSAFLHIGQAGEIVDNHGKDRYFVQVLPDGTLTETGYNDAWQKRTETGSGYRFQGLSIPNYERVKAVVTEAHRQYPHFHIIGWDICLDQGDTPVIIEANLRSMGVIIPQLTCGPFFGDRTDEVLSELRSQRNYE